MNLVKVGIHYINLDLITDILDSEVDSLIIYFGDGIGDKTTLYGTDADLMRKCLKSMARDLEIEK